MKHSISIKVLSLFLCLALLLSVSPIFVLAQDDHDSQVVVAGITVTDENCNQILGEGNNSITYDFETKTLYFNNASLIEEDNPSEMTRNTILAVADTITIHLSGTNTIDASHLNRIGSYIGIYCSNKLVFEGDGSLYIATAPAADTATFGIYARGLTMNTTGMVTLIAGEAPISAGAFIDGVYSMNTHNLRDNYQMDLDDNTPFGMMATSCDRPIAAAQFVLDGTVVKACDYEESNLRDIACFVDPAELCEDDEAFPDCKSMFIGWEAFAVSVTGKSVSACNYKDVLGDGTVFYDPNKAILTLNNAKLNNITQNPYYLNEYDGIRFYEGTHPYDSKFTIHLIGSNEIKVSDPDKNCYTTLAGIFGSGNLVFTGSGDLSIVVNGKNENNGICVSQVEFTQRGNIRVEISAGAKESYGIYTKQVSIKDMGSLYVKADKQAIEITGGDLNLESPDYYALYGSTNTADTDLTATSWSDIESQKQISIKPSRGLDSHLIVGGQKVTTKNCNNFSEDQSIYYSFEENELVLNNANITTYDVNYAGNLFEEEHASILYNGNEKLKIRLIGNNVIQSIDDNGSYEMVGIYSPNADVEIYGEGSLSIVLPTTLGHTGAAFAEGIYSHQSVHINNANVNITGVSEYGDSGIITGNTVAILGNANVSISGVDIGITTTHVLIQDQATADIQGLIALSATNSEASITFDTESFIHLTGEERAIAPIGEGRIIFGNKPIQDGNHDGVAHEYFRNNLADFTELYFLPPAHFKTSPASGVVANTTYRLRWELVGPDDTNRIPDDLVLETIDKNAETITKAEDIAEPEHGYYDYYIGLDNQNTARTYRLSAHYNIGDGYTVYSDEFTIVFTSGITAAELDMDDPVIGQTPASINKTVEMTYQMNNDCVGLTPEDVDTVEYKWFERPTGTVVWNDMDAHSAFRKGYEYKIELNIGLDNEMMFFTNYCNASFTSKAGYDTIKTFGMPTSSTGLMSITWPELTEQVEYVYLHTQKPEVGKTPADVGSYYLTNNLNDRVVYQRDTATLYWYWYSDDEEQYIQMQNTDKFVAGREYKAVFKADLDTNHFTFANDFYGKTIVNGSIKNSSSDFGPFLQDDTHMTLVATYPSLKERIGNVDIHMVSPRYDQDTNDYRGELYIATVVNGRIWPYNHISVDSIYESSDRKSYHEFDEYFDEDMYYTLVMHMEVYPDYYIHPEDTFTVDGKPCTILARSESDLYFAYSTYIPPLDEITVVDEVLISSDSMEIGQVINDQVYTYTTNLEDEDPIESILFIWYNTTDNKTVEGDEKFEKGKSYYTYAIINAKQGYYLNIYTGYNYKLNNHRLFNPSDLYSPPNGQIMIVSEPFVMQEELNDSIYITAPEPRVGGTPVLDTTKAQTTFEDMIIDGISFVRYTEEGQHTYADFRECGENMTSSDLFEKEQPYSLAIHVTVDNGWKITQNTKWYINGNPATYYPKSGMVVFEYPKLNVLNSLNTSMTAPTAGMTPNDVVVSIETNPANVVISYDVVWYNMDGLEDVKLASTDVFQEGSLYGCQIENVVLASSYAMDSETIITTNGEAPYCEPLYDFDTNTIENVSFEPIVIQNKPTITYGDANGDNVVDMKDVLAVRKKIAGMNVDPYVSVNADVNGDNKIDMKDVLAIRKFLAHIVDHLGPQN